MTIANEIVLNVAQMVMKNNFAEIHPLVTSQIFFVVRMRITYYLEATILLGHSVMKILVVDDEPMHIDLISELLASQNHLVVSALAAEEAIKLLTSNKFDLIISDIEMPNMNGTAFHSYLQQHAEFSNIPFLFLTGLDNPTSLSYFKDKPLLTIVTKSNVKELLRMVDKYTARL